MPKPVTTRTLGPLHLEDLEPHRFEDLVRQLVYDFRSWRYLEPTGRTGSDEGFDARGWEIVSREVEVDTDTEEDAEESTSTDRLWLVQCKRERSIGPTKLVEYLEEIPEAERGNIYGVVFAAACDFSKTARDRFRERCRAFGFSECHLWGKGEIEDTLFQPKNDHLLFAYFGFSLQTRKRALKTDIRARLAVKKKAKATLEQHFGRVLVRDASDDRYPHLAEDKTQSRFERGRWRLMLFEECGHDGLRVKYGRHCAFLDDDSTQWDFAETMNDSDLSEHEDPWRDPDDAARSWDARQKIMEQWEALPEDNRAWFDLIAIVPYENIVAIDEDGDDIVRVPHVYTAPWHHEHGPFRPGRYATLRTVGTLPRTGVPRRETRVDRFPRPAAKAKPTKRRRKKS